MSETSEKVTLYSPGGRKVEGLERPAEIVRLRSAGYTDSPPEQLQVTESPAAPPVVFDPAEHTVDEVKAFVAEHPELAEPVVAAEKAGKNRSSITSA